MLPSCNACLHQTSLIWNRWPTIIPAAMRQTKMAQTYQNPVGQSEKPDVDRRNSHITTWFEVQGRFAHFQSTTVRWLRICSFLAAANAARRGADRCLQALISSNIPSAPALAQRNRFLSVLGRQRHIELYFFDRRTHREKTMIRS